MLASKLLNTIKKKKRGKGALVALKMDMSKAYDQVC